MEEQDSPQQAPVGKTEQLREHVTELKKENARLRAVLCNLNSTVVMGDAQGRFTYVSPQVEELLGITPDEAVGQLFYEWIHPDDLPMLMEAMTTALSGEPVFDVEYRVRHQTGSWVQVSATGRVVTDEQDTWLVAVLHDITKRRKTEEELLKARKLESIGLLAGGIAHDFNNVLSTILGNLNVARMRCDNEHAAHPLLVDAEKATLRARKLTQRLLTFARGGQPIKSAARVSTLLEEAIDSVLPEGAARPTVELSRRLWAVEVDPGQARQAFEHLLHNALCADAADDLVTIRASNVRIGTDEGTLLPGCYVRVAFEDRGPNIPPAKRADVFDPYFGDKTPDSALGLATAFSIASRHGGTITVEAPAETGSVLAIHLPASLSPTEEHALTKAKIAGEGRRILVMDDERAVLRVAGRMLESLQFEVTLTSDGDEAIAAFEEARAQSKPFHAVMLDLTVPGGLGGRDTLQRLREIDPEVRAIVASGYSDDAVMANYAQHGFRAVLAKPYQLAELAAALHRTL